MLFLFLLKCWSSLYCFHIFGWNYTTWFSWYFCRDPPLLLLTFLAVWTCVLLNICEGWISKMAHSNHGSSLFVFDFLGGVSSIEKKIEENSKILASSFVKSLLKHTCKLSNSCFYPDRLRQSLEIFQDFFIKFQKKI